MAKLYDSDGFQKFVAGLLLINFCLNVVDAEFADDREQEMKANEDDGTYARIATYFDVTDLVFTAFYIIELMACYVSCNGNVLCSIGIRFDACTEKCLRLSHCISVDVCVCVCVCVHVYAYDAYIDYYTCM